METLCDILDPIHLHDAEHPVPDKIIHDDIPSLSLSISQSSCEQISSEFMDDLTREIPSESLDSTELDLPNENHKLNDANESICIGCNNTVESVDNMDPIETNDIQESPNNFIPLPLLDLTTDFQDLLGDFNECNDESLSITEPIVSIESKNIPQKKMDSLNSNNLQNEKSFNDFHTIEIDIPLGIDKVWDSAIFTDPIVQVKEAPQTISPTPIDQSLISIPEPKKLVHEKILKTTPIPCLNIPSKSRTKVSFKPAWKGELETIKYINHHDIESEVEIGNLGILIVQCNSISELKLDGRRGFKSFILQ